MFCKWCGEKITNNGIPCPSCGKIQDVLENGNGFWDLCSSKLEEDNTAIGATPKVIPTQESTERKKNHKNLLKKNNIQHRKITFVSYVLSINAVIMLLILIIEVGIGLNKIEQCLGQFFSLAYEIDSVTGIVNSRFDELMKYLIKEESSEIIQTPEDVNNQEIEKNNENANVEALLNSDNILFLLDTEINIEIHELDSRYVEYVCIASGERLADENVKIYWQKKKESNGSWETISSHTTYLVVENNDEAYYRILCVAYNDYNSEYVCYYSTVNIASVNGI